MPNFAQSHVSHSCGTHGHPGRPLPSCCFNVQPGVRRPLGISGGRCPAAASTSSQVSEGCCGASLPISPNAWPKVSGKAAARLWRQLWLWSCVVAFVVGGVPVVIVGGRLGGSLPPECSAAAALSQARKKKRACISCMLRLYSGTAYQNHLGPADGRSCC